MSEILKRFSFEKRMTTELRQIIPEGDNFTVQGNFFEISGWQLLTIAEKNSIRALAQANGLGEEDDVIVGIGTQ